MAKFKPLLAAKMPEGQTVEEIVKTLEYPLYASPKLDGIRVLRPDEVPLTRKLKKVPNRFITEKLSHRRYEGFDGEILTVDSVDKKAFRKTTSGVMSHKGEPDFVWYVFDLCNMSDRPFEYRYNELKARAEDTKYAELVKQTLIKTPGGLLVFEKECLELGYEGSIIRSRDGKYKFGRSTWKQGILRKLTRTIREEGTIVGYEERMHNGNEAVEDELGRMKRSSHKANKTGRGDLGAFIVKHPRYKKPFSVGSGYDDKERAKYWGIRDKMIGKTMTFEHRPYGDYDAPRFPVFIGIRDKRDM